MVKPSGMACTVSAVLFLMNLSGCQAEKRKTSVSDNAAALHKLVDLDIQATTTRWEAYDSPEAKRFEFLPTSPDQTILVAELAPVAPEPIAAMAPGSKLHVAADSPRDWLSAHSRALLMDGAKDGAAGIDTSSISRCRSLTVLYKLKNAPAHGFICSVDKKALVYLTLASYF